ncbi:MAG: geranylgeranyl reductase family protein [Saprospiraceae bacterium]|nr:geranylgeranyl reductase family protein [Saprospiraceae bacterium]
MVSIQPVHNYDTDVLIIGGGPGGSTLAAHLARAGVRVLLVEREVFPRDKVCGDAVSPVALQEMQLLDITGVEGFERSNEIKHAGLYFKGEKITVIDLPKGNTDYHTHVIPRLTLDNWVFEMAVQCGAAVLQNASLVKYTVTENAVYADVKQGGAEKRLKARIIVGADGSNSTVARQMHGAKPTDYERLIAVRSYWEGIHGPADTCEIHFMEDNFPGLYWVFPTGPHTANIGLGMVARTYPKNETHVKELLINQIGANPGLIQRIGKGTMNGKVLGWPLTMYNPKSPVVSDRVLLIGDAAGLINSLSGDGIQYAMLSGRWAAQTLVACIKQNDFSAAALNSYTQQVKKELGYDFALSNLLVQIARNRALNPVWMRILLVLIERARTDPAYATVLGGIFGGTHPSYDALQPDFILKTLLQGGVHVGMGATESLLGGPLLWQQNGQDAGRFALDAVQKIRNEPGVYARWAGNVAKRGLEVSGYVVRKILENKESLK